MKRFERLTQFFRAGTSVLQADRAQKSSRSDDQRSSAPSDSITQDQIEIIGDPERMREIFESHLRRLDNKAYRIQECEVHIHHRLPTRCRVQYTLRLTEPETGREWSQTVTGMILAGGQTRGVWENLSQQLDVIQDFPDAFQTFAPLHYVPELDMLVQVFPYDRLLRALPLLMAESPPERIESRLLGWFGTGDWHTEEWGVEAVKYLAELRATLRITMQARNAETGEAKEKRFYAKVYVDEEKAEQTCQALRTLWSKNNAGGTSFTVGEPVLYLSELRTLIQSEVPGVSLREMILQGEDATPALRSTARALAALHLNDIVSSKVHRPEDEIAVLRRIGSFVAQACPRLKPEIEESIITIAANLKEAPLSPTHGDLNLGHIILQDGRLTFLDLDEFAGADPMRDVARALANFATLSYNSSVPHDRARAFAQILAEEYFAHVPESWRESLPFYYASNIIKMSGGLARFKKPDWNAKIEALMEEAKDSLAGRSQW